MPKEVANLEVKHEEFSSRDMWNLKQRYSMHKEISGAEGQNSGGLAEKRKIILGKDTEHTLRSKPPGPPTFLKIELGYRRGKRFKALMQEVASNQEVMVS